MLAVSLSLAAGFVDCVADSFLELFGPFPALSVACLSLAADSVAEFVESAESALLYIVSVAVLFLL